MGSENDTPRFQSKFLPVPITPIAPPAVNASQVRPRPPALTLLLSHQSGPATLTTVALLTPSRSSNSAIPSTALRPLAVGIRTIITTPMTITTTTIMSPMTLTRTAKAVTNDKLKQTTPRSASARYYRVLSATSSVPSKRLHNGGASLPSTPR